MMTVQRRALLHSVATSTLVGLLLLLHSSETWSHPGSGCWPPEIPLNSRVRHGILPFYSIGESLEYVCRYEIRGRATVTCIWDFDGIHWNHGPPTCSVIATETPISCVPLEDPKGGRVYIGKTTPGSQAEYTCHSGYLLEGYRTRTCLMDGSWSGKTPLCTYIVCGDLHNPSNGKVSVNGIHLGSHARYRCDRGYNMIGICMRTCQENRQWSHREPTCVSMGCQPIESPANGQVLISGQEFGDTATYSCSSGFSLEGGNSLRTCLDNGEWSGKASHCVDLKIFHTAAQCEAVDPPINGFVELSGREVGSVATYSCDSGHDVVGNSTRTCQHNGKWSGEEPICRKAVTCGYLFQPYNGKVEWNSQSVGSVATYTCNTGFTLAGSGERTCQQDGEWSGVKPYCNYAGVICGRLINPKNADIIQTGNSLQSIATYICDDGFELKGPNVRVCQSDGQWSEREPECIATLRNCSMPSDPDNGSVSVNGLTPHSLASYSCDSGQGLVGGAFRVCLRNGSWSDQEPFCAIDCGGLPELQYGHVELTTTTEGSVAVYVCILNFTLRGNDKRTCLPSREWSHYAPLCYADSCPDLLTLANGTVNWEQAVVGAVALYTCNAGFALEGPSFRTCLINGTWSEHTPTCKSYVMSDCSLLSSIEHGSVEMSGISFGSVARYSCSSGYILHGNPTRNCTGSGQWSGIEPTCTSRNEQSKGEDRSRIQDNHCQDVTAPADGHVYVQCKKPGCYIRLWCETGFKLVGPDRLECQQDGTWSDYLPTCTHISGIQSYT